MGKVKKKKDAPILITNDVIKKALDELNGYQAWLYEKLLGISDLGRGNWPNIRPN